MPSGSNRSTFICDGACMHMPLSLRLRIALGFKHRTLRTSILVRVSGTKDLVPAAAASIERTAGKFRCCQRGVCFRSAHTASAFHLTPASMLAGHPACAESSAAVCGSGRNSMFMTAVRAPHLQVSKQTPKSAG